MDTNLASPVFSLLQAFGSQLGFFLQSAGLQLKVPFEMAAIKLKMVLPEVALLVAFLQLDGLQDFVV